MRSKPKSFSTRLSLYIISLVGLFFTLSFLLYFTFASNAIKSEAFQKSNNQLAFVSKSVDAILEGVELSVKTTSLYSEQALTNLESYKTILSNMIESNPSIYGAGIALEPHFYKNNNTDYLYGTRSNQVDSNKNSLINFTLLDHTTYPYPTSAWYEIPKKLNKGYWSEPYNSGLSDKVAMTSYSKPLHNEKGEFVGILVADITLDWLSNMVLENKPYKDSYAFMLSRKGYFLVHKDRQQILNPTAFSSNNPMNTTRASEIEEEMVSGKSGNKLFNQDGIDYYAFYQPIKRTGWSIGVVSSKEMILAEFTEMTNIVFFIASISLLLIFIFTLLVIRTLSKPLKIFSKSASMIAMGDFNVQLPEIKTEDEMLNLRDAFVNMQTSLKSYISELKNTTAERERIERELEIAQAIQVGMLSKVFPPFPNHESIDLYAKLTPAKEVGGDLYDFFIHDNKLFFAVGDASGKGIPASLLMAVTISLFRSSATHTDAPDEILRKMNTLIAEGNESNMFITLFVGVLDLGTGELNFSNAGHNPPILINPDGSINLIDVIPNMALGVFQDIKFVKQTIKIELNTTIFVYTDGVTEAENREKDLYSDQRLIDTINKKCKSTNPQNFITNIEESINDFVQGNEQSDDLTMLVLSYKSKLVSKELIIKNEIAEISHLAEFVESLGEDLSLELPLVMSLNLALEEVISNIILYACPEKMGNEINIKATKVDNSVIFTISDFGVEFDPTAVPEADVTLSANEREIGGLGIFLVRKIMDKTSYQRIENKNILTITKQIK
ncbi:MAG: SpoIIE family protein phosphatase [Phocaeicola sp.]